MVYCGKPSMGCTTCRERRIKCDETKPICKQCVKSRRECSGYRSDFDILHRDETRATETRAKKAAAKKAAKRAADGGGGGAIIQFEALPKPQIKQEPPTTTTTFTSWHASPPAADRTTSPPSSSTALTTTAVPSAAHTHAHTVPRETRFPIAAPALPLDQHAAHYFAAHFIMLPGEHGTKNGHLNYLVPLLRTETNPSSAFQLAYSACGLAAMSNREKAVHTDLVELAFMQHGRALQAVGAALRDPVLCKRDATLAAVLLLTFFENITASKEFGLKAWRSHVEGSSRIIKSRGSEMWQQNKYSMGLFNAVRLQIIARTLSSGTAPSMGVKWWTRDTDIADPCGARFQRFCLEISDIRAEVTRLMATLPRHGHGMDLMLEMLRKTQDLDRNIVNWLETLPAEYHFSTLYYEDGAGAAAAGLRDTPVFPGPVDVYHDLVTAQLRNGMRSSRIILSSLIIRIAAWICSPADYRLTPEYATAVGTIKRNIEEVVSSVPFILSTYNKGHRARPGPNAGSFLCGADQQSKMVGGKTVSWSLGTILTCDFTTDEQREWTIGRLHYIAYDLGIRYAASLADCKIRFPSMLVRTDGLMSAQNPLRDLQKTLAPQTIPVR